MIKHLHNREKALESFGWKGREAEWVALVCLHSGVFTRAQFCYFFDTGPNRKRAERFVRDLVDRRLGVVDERSIFPGGAKAVRISNKEIYRKLGIENVRHRREAEDAVMLRRLLSLDYVLEHPELPWLPTEQEKVAFFESLGIDRNRIPKRVYQGAVGRQVRYFAHKLPIAVAAESATFAYVDPGKDTDKELRSWGDSHEWLWRTLREKGIEVRAVAIGADYGATVRAEAALQTWSKRAADPNSQRANGSTRNDPAVQAEIQHLKNAVLTMNMEVLMKHGGVQGISKRIKALKDLPKSAGSAGVTIDRFETWVSDRLRMQESGA